MMNDLAVPYKFRKLMKYPTALGRIVIVIINNIYCIPTYVVWMTMLIPLKCLHPDTYYKIEGLFFHWLLAVVSMWSYSAGYDIVECGDDIAKCKNRKTLVIANHQSTADVPLLMANFNAKDNILPNIMWIMDRLFKYTNFGIVSIIHQDFFISSGRKNRQISLTALRNHIKSSFLIRNRNWMVLFPEGGFLRKRKETSKRFAQKNNLPILNNVTLPRIGAFKEILDVMSIESKIQINGTITTNQVNSINNGDVIENDSTTIREMYDSKGNCCLEYILDITIAYPNGVPLDLPNIVHGLREPCQTYMLYRLYKVSEIPTDEQALSHWLYTRFAEKNELLENFYKHGYFYLEGKNNASVIQQDILRFALINLFFITSTYFHYQMFCTLYRFCFLITSDIL